MSILDSFEEKEWNKFEDFLRSPFFDVKSQAQVIDIYLVIKNHYAEKENTFPNDNQLWNVLKQKDTLNTNYLTNLLYELNTQAKRFLAYSYYESTSSYLFNNLRIHSQLALPKIFKRFHDKLVKRASKKAVKNETEYFENYLWKKEVDIFYGKTDRKFDRISHLQEMTTDLDYSYLIGKLKQYCILLSKVKEKNELQGFTLFKKYLADYMTQFELNAASTPPLLQVYLQMLKTIEEKTFANIAELRELFFAYGDAMEERDKSNVRQTIINLYTQQINKGIFLYRQELFDYYKKLDSENLLTNRKNEIQYLNYQNAVLNAFELSAANEAQKTIYLQWADKFIRKCKKRIYPHQYAENAYNFATGSLLFQQKKWAEAEDIADKLTSDPKNPYYSLRGYVLCIRSLYELKNNSERLEFKRKSLYNYARRKSLKSHTKEHFKEFAIIIKQFIQLKTKNLEEPVYKKLKKEIEEKKKLLHRNWLLEKLEEASNKSQ
ncbi:MAG: hypothetical protein R3E32_02340 [Chitinophagales bacterium]